MTKRRGTSSTVYRIEPVRCDAKRGFKCCQCWSRLFQFEQQLAELFACGKKRAGCDRMFFSDVVEVGGRMHQSQRFLVRAFRILDPRGCNLSLNIDLSGPIITTAHFVERVLNRRQLVYRFTG